MKKLLMLLFVFHYSSSVFSQTNVSIGTMETSAIHESSNDLTGDANIFPIVDCKEESNPNVWLYRQGAYRFKDTKPRPVDHASKITVFFDAFVFVGTYSFVRSGKDKLFYLMFSGPASYPYDVTESDSLSFHFKDQESLKLAPLMNYPGKKGCEIAFYKLNLEFLNKMSQVSLDSIVLKFTPRPKDTPKDESKILHSFTFKNFSEKNVQLFKDYSTCFKKEF